MTTQLTLNRKVALGMLMDALLAEFPEWSVPLPTDEHPNARHVLITLTGNEQTAWLSIPSGTDETRLNRVLESHNPAAKSVGEKERETKVATIDSIRIKLKTIGFTEAEIDLLVSSQKG